MSDPVTFALNKSGETPIQMSFDRTHLGLTVEVKTLKSVEDFMRGLGNGNYVLVGAVGRHWQATDPSLALRAYELTANIPPTSTFELGRLGCPLIDDGSGVANLSFLRLVGVSEGAGVRFGVRGVHSYSGVCDLRDQLGKAAKQFYIDFLKPMHITVMISTQDLRL